MPKPRRSKPRYAELAEHFTDCIARGDYPVGGLLPTELEICERFAVSRHTARTALGQLIAAGLVSRRAGAGTRVLAPHPGMRYQHDVDSIETLLQYGNQTRLDVRETGLDRADAALALQLGIAEGTAILRIRGLRLERPTGVAVAATAIVLPVVRGLPVERLLDRESTERTVVRLVDLSRLSRVDQVFDAARFPREAAHDLDVPPNTPALRVQRCYRGANDRLIAYSLSLHPAERFAYRVVLSRRSG